MNDAHSSNRLPATKAGPEQRAIVRGRSGRCSCRSRLGIALILALGASTASADVKIAFLGDQSTHGSARAVLSLVKNEGVDLLVSQGDLGYSGGPAKWGAVMDSELGSNFPVLAVVGNHEEQGWPGYQRWLERRIAAVPDLSCRGEVGVKARCTFRGISILQVAPGVHEVAGVASRDDYDGYLRRELANDSNAWRICSWHKQMTDMQVGGKGDSTGWGVYEACREGGGIIATAHEHSYSRTHLLSDFPNQRVVHRRDHLEVGPGQTFAFVSGLGGKSVRPQLRGGDWWASIYSETQGATHGALICSFGTSRASCEFKAIDGAVPDRFTLETRNAAAFGSSGGGSDRSPGTPQPAPLPSDAPAAPSGLRADVYSSRSAELFWNRASTPGLRYEIRRDGATIATTDGISRYERGLSGGRSYRYEVVAIDRQGRRSAPASITVQAGGPSSGGTVAPFPSPAPTPPASGTPATPSGLRADVYSSRSAELFWNRASTPGLRYEIRRDGATIATTDGISRYERGLSGGRSYRYEVIAIDRQGRRSAPASITVQAGGSSSVGTVVASPAEQPATGLSSGSVTRGSTIVPGALSVKLSVYDRRSYELIWERVAGATRYRLSTGNGQVVQDGEKVSRYFGGIDSSRTTDYRIEAFDRTGRALRAVTVRVAPQDSAQLSPLD